MVCVEYLSGILEYQDPSAFVIVEVDGKEYYITTANYMIRDKKVIFKTRLVDASSNH